MSDTPASWQPDPTGKHDHRYWDGTRWTDDVADAGVASTDPYDPAAVSPDAPTAVTPVPSDDTAPYPTAAPPPYVPPSPVGTGGAATGGRGSRRGLIIGGAILAAVALAVIALGALGGDDDESVESQLASSLASAEGVDVSAEQAECIAHLLVEEVGEDAFEDVDLDADEPSPALMSAVLSIGISRFVEECDLHEDTFGDVGGGPTDSSDEGEEGGEESLEDLEEACADGDLVACDDLYFAADVGSELEEFGSTCGGTADPQEGFCEETNGGEDPLTTDGFSDGDMEDTLNDAYEGMGLSEEQAECLTDRIIEAMESGELNEEEAMAEVFSYLSECDISMEDLDAN